MTIIITRQISLGELIDPHVNNKKKMLSWGGGLLFAYGQQMCLTDWLPGAALEYFVQSNTKQKLHMRQDEATHNARESMA